MGDSAQLDHKALHNAFKRIKEKFKDHSELKTAFYKLRGKIHTFIGNCVNNVKVTIYIDEVLDDPIEIRAGAGENDFIITIDKDANVTYSWTRETWGKVLRDAWNKAKDITERIIGFIASKVGTLISLATSALPALAL
nr:uncharacterized protein LOC117684354 [Crassostrea gigas]